MQALDIDTDLEQRLEKWAKYFRGGPAASHSVAWSRGDTPCGAVIGMPDDDLQRIMLIESAVAILPGVGGTLIRGYYVHKERWQATCRKAGIAVNQLSYESAMRDALKCLKDLCEKYTGSDGKKKLTGLKRLRYISLNNLTPAN